MSDREELMALRRMAELEAKSGGQTQAPTPEPQTSKFISGLSGATQGASSGFGDELLAAASTLPVKGFSEALNAMGVDTKGLSDKGIVETYEFLQREIDKGNQQAQADNPGSYLAGNIVGALGAGVAGATTKTGTMLANSLRTGGLPMRALKGAAASAIPAAAYRAGTAAPGERGDAATDVHALDFIGGAFPVLGAAGKSIGKEVKSLAPKVAKTSATLRDEAKPFYDAFTKSGARYSSKLTEEIADLADAAKSTGIAGSIKKSDAALNDTLDFYSGLRGKSLTPKDLQKLDQSLATDISRFNKAGEYEFGRALKGIKAELRKRAYDPAKAANYVSGGSPDAVNGLIEGNKRWAQSYKAKDIERIIKKAAGTENPQTSIRTGLKNLLANDEKMALYSADEKAALEFALKRGYLGGLTKLFGGRLTDSVAGGIAGNAIGGAPGAIAGSVAGKAMGGVAADISGGVQANRLRGALQQIQNSALSNAPQTTLPRIPSQLDLIANLLAGQSAGSIND